MAIQPSNKRKQSVCPSSGAGQWTKKQKVVVQQPLPTLNKRSCPKHLYNAMMTLSTRQKEVVENIGLGAF
ncbi:hypothetical protein HanXRQr2_Chr16g0765931 [Helianthus annuus]|uniref:Uncharacterized protein n=1 Tax=Helianthus annuus TaxID=4232 RepID=A0A251S1V7_HELAN|nr:hypothetical protein HanXRQr2_Chr16g0765931 [Helianthus annuus]KAJ0439354.1 hypothetical protein HanHA300_Chr16g0624381 [Helianthus annuus]KAJ0461703.1 hypothetical protein HanHA89_Chr16g0675291 [Helianthus annuus]KAJ0822611.1 hypothetical protein HanPSC8_Chr16g0734091 [Helianthus annuus]